MKRGYRKFSMVLLIGGVGLFVFLWISAGRLVSPPRRELQEYHRSYLETPSGHGLIVTPMTFLDGKVPVVMVQADAAVGPAKRGRILRGQLGERGHEIPVYGEERALLVLLHGRNGRKEDLFSVAERFCAAGFVCLVPDLPAHGESSVMTVAFGSTEFEAGLPGEIADEALACLGRKDLPQYLWGMSMGGSFAVYSVNREPARWKRLIIVASFDSLEGVVSDSVGPLTPIISPMVEWRGGSEVLKVNPGQLATGISIPVLVVHGDEDELIDHSRGKNLFDAFDGPKKFLTVPGGNHQNVLVTDAPVYAEMAEWYLEGFTSD